MIDSLCDGCITPYRVYGDGNIRLEIKKQDCLIDLNPFFQDLFEQRDRWNGDPDGFNRWEETSEGTGYHFSMVELLEATLGRYEPNYFADFMERHLIRDSEQAEALVKRIRGAYKNYRFAFRWWRGHHGHIAAINFDINVIDKIIPKGFLFNTKDPGHRIELPIGYPPLLQNYFEKKRAGYSSTPPLKRGAIKAMYPRIRQLIEPNPIILLCPGTDVDLDFLGLISRFNLPHKHLKIVRA